MEIFIIEVTYCNWNIDFAIMNQKLWMDIDDRRVYCLTNFSWN